MEDVLSIYPPLSAARNEIIKETVKKERGRLFDFIKKRVANESDAEDILQDVFYQYVSNVDIDAIERTASWLFTVAGNKIIDWYRKRKPVRLDDQLLRMPEDEEGNDLYLGLEELLLDTDSNSDDEFATNVVMEELEAALSELPPAQRDVFVWHEMEGRSFKEIAEMTGDPVNTLLSRKRYAILYLRNRMRNLYDELLNN